MAKRTRTRPIRPVRQTNPRRPIRLQPIWPLFQTLPALRPREGTAVSRPLRRRGRPVRRTSRFQLLTRRLPRTIQTTASRPWLPLPTHRRPCPNTISRPRPAMTISGPPGTGAGLRRATTGFLACGCRHRMRVRSGLPATGALCMAVMATSAAIGGRILASTAASTTGSAMRAPATRAGTGTPATSFITVRSTTSTPLSSTTCIATRLL